MDLLNFVSEKLQIKVVHLICDDGFDQEFKDLKSNYKIVTNKDKDTNEKKILLIKNSEYFNQNTFELKQNTKAIIIHGLPIGYHLNFFHFMDTNLHYIYNYLFNKFKPTQRVCLDENVFVELLVHENVTKHFKLKEDEHFVNFDKQFPKILFNHWIINSFHPPTYKLARTDRDIIHYFYRRIENFDDLKQQLSDHLRPWREKMIEMYHAMDHLSESLSTDDLPFAFNCASLSHDVIDDETYYRKLIDFYKVEEPKNVLCKLCFKKSEYEFCDKECQSIFEKTVS